MLTYELEPRPIRALNPSKEARFSFFSFATLRILFQALNAMEADQLNHREQCAPKAATYAATHSLAHRIERSRRDLGVQERLVLCHWKKHLFQIWAETWFFVFCIAEIGYDLLSSALTAALLNQCIGWGCFLPCFQLKSTTSAHLELKIFFQ